MQKIGLQGICYDEKSSYLRGPAMAPALIREAYRCPSANYFAENGMDISPLLFRDHGDFEPTDYFDIEGITANNLQKNIPLLTLGGDHSITYPIIKAFHSAYGTLDILHIDAHSDLYTDFEGDPYSHACPFYNIKSAGLADNLVQLGIRTLSAEQRENAEKFDVSIFEMARLDEFQMPTFKNPLYLSLDIDALDPAFAPGVSHHEPGGLSTRQVISMIQAIDAPLVGADIVEYNPKRDHDSMTAMVCAKLLREISGKILQSLP